MANVENINKAIAVMERVKKHEQELGRRIFDLSSFQGRNGKGVYRKPLKTEKGVLNHCGTTCCMAGWLAVSPEFREMGLSLTNDGYLTMTDADEDDADRILAMIFDVEGYEMERIIFNDDFEDGMFFGKPSKNVTIDEVIAALQALIPGETE